MGRKKKIDVIDPVVPIDQVNEVQEKYLQEVETDPKYSLEVDPENKYNMSEFEKAFVKHYVEFKNVNTAAELSNIDMNLAKQYFISYPVQNEIRRINKALYQKQFANKLLTIDDIGGYLTSLLTDENVPIADRLKTKDKLKVVELMLQLNQLKSQSFEDPSVLMNKNFEIEIKNLSIKTITQLLNNADDQREKPNIDEAFNQLTPEEKAYLETLPPEDLLKLIEETNNENTNK